MIGVPHLQFSQGPLSCELCSLQLLVYSVFTQSHATTQIARGEQGQHSSLPMPSLWFLKSIASIALIKEEKVLYIKNLPETKMETLNKKSLLTFYAL
jgi:hypothetical protein